MSIHSSHIQEEHLVPISVITRPFPSELDEDKVKSLMETIEKEPDNVPAIDILWLNEDGNDYYFSFGGCHRYEAHKRLNKQMIKAKLIPTSRSTIERQIGTTLKLKKN